jgi:hypothetical protein
MPELNREEIIKALECCIEVNCGSIAICPYREKFKNCYECQANLKKEALALINQLIEEKREIFEEIEENLKNLIRYYKEKRKYVTEVDYNELEQRYCDIKIRTFEERLLKIADLKKKHIGE